MDKVINLAEIRQARKALGIPVNDPVIISSTNEEQNRAKIKKSLDKINKLLAELKEYTDKNK
jgi:hypothetical protein